MNFDDPEDPRSQGGPVSFMVRIVKENNRKLYLGGYRSRKTGLVYHHGSTQTLREVVEYTGPEKFTRECQTAIEVTRSVQTKRENGTQMKRKDIYIVDKNDKELMPKEYFTSAQLHDLKVRKTIIMQCFWRGYVARCGIWSPRGREISVPSKKKRKSNELLLKRSTNGWNAA